MILPDVSLMNSLRVSSALSQILASSLSCLRQLPSVWVVIPISSQALYRGSHFLTSHPTSVICGIVRARILRTTVHLSGYSHRLLFEVVLLTIFFGIIKYKQTHAYIHNTNKNPKRKCNLGNIFIFVFELIENN